jgi:hypothetical protein
VPTSPPTQAPTAPPPTATPIPTPTRTPDPTAPAIKGLVSDQTGAPYGGVCVTIGPPIRCAATTADNGTYFISLESAPTGIAWDVRFLVSGVVKVERLGVVVNGPTVINVTIAR